MIDAGRIWRGRVDAPEIERLQDGRLGCRNKTRRRKRCINGERERSSRWATAWMRERANGYCMRLGTMSWTRVAMSLLEQAVFKSTCGKLIRKKSVIRIRYLMQGRSKAMWVGGSGK